MPSLVAPLVLAPKLVMTRPRTGQRKVGTAPVLWAAAGAAASGGVSVAGLARRAVAVAGGAGRLLGAGAASGLAACCLPCCLAGCAGEAVWVLIWAWCTPGTVRRCPTRTTVFAAMPLALAISPRDLP